jgi:hypothetical protein
MTHEGLKKLVKRFLYVCYGLTLLVNVASICFAYNSIPNYSTIIFSSISSKTLSIKLMKCNMFTTSFYEPMLGFQLHVLLVILLGTPLAVQAYMLILKHLNRLNTQTTRLSTVYLMISLWLTISPALSVLYYYALKETEKCVLVSESHKLLHCYYKEIQKHTYNLMCLNASGFLLLLNSVYFSLVKYGLSHVVLRRQVQSDDLNVSLLSDLPQFAFFFISNELMLYAFRGLFEIKV